MALDFELLSLFRLIGGVVKPCLQSSACIFRHLIELRHSIAILPFSNPWIPFTMIIALVLIRSNTHVVDGQAGFGSTKQRVRNKEMFGILNCAENFYKCKLN